MSRLKSRGRLLWQLSWQGQLSDYITAIAWSPNTKVLAACSAAGELGLVGSSQTLTMLETQTHCSLDCLGFSANGQYLAAGGQEGHLLVWQDLQPGDTGAANVSQLSLGCWIEHLAWHPTQPWLAFNVGRYVQVWDAVTQDIVATLPFENSSALCFVWSPDGNWLAVGGYQGIKVWSARDWHQDPHQLDLASASVALAWSQDGQYLAAGNLDRTVAVMQWKPQQQQADPWLMRGFPTKVQHLAWCAVQTETPPILATASGDGVVVWYPDAEPFLGWEGQLPREHTGFVKAIAFQPHGFLLATAGADGCLYLWEQGAKSNQMLRGFMGRFSALDWHPQDQSIAAGGSDGQLAIWSAGKAGMGFQKN